MRYLLLLALLPATSFAQLHKCTMPDGKIEYTDKQCAAGSQSSLSVVDNAILDGQQFRRSEQQMRARKAQEQGSAFGSGGPNCMDPSEIEALEQKASRTRAYSASERKHFRDEASRGRQCRAGVPPEQTNRQITDRDNQEAILREMRRTRNAIQTAADEARIRSNQNRDIELRCKPSMLGNGQMDCRSK